jgi:hypothetical protein
MAHDGASLMVAWETPDATRRGTMRHRNPFILLTLVIGLLFGTVAVANAAPGDHGHVYGEDWISIEVDDDTEYAETLAVTFHNENPYVMAGDTQVEYAVSVVNETGLRTKDLVTVEAHFDPFGVLPSNPQYCTDTEPAAGSAYGLTCVGDWLDLLVTSEPYEPPTPPYEQRTIWFTGFEGIEIPADYSATTLIRADFPVTGHVNGLLVATGTGTGW